MRWVVSTPYWLIINLVLQKGNTNCNYNSSKLSVAVFTIGGLLRPLVIIDDRYCPMSPHTPPPVCVLCLNFKYLKFMREAVCMQESFLVSCLAECRPQSLKCLGSIIRQVNNNKQVNASFSSLNSNWGTSTGLLFSLLSFSPPVALSASAVDHPELCSSWSWMPKSKQFADRLREPEATENSVVEMLKLSLERPQQEEEELVLLLQTRHGIHLDFHTKVLQNNLEE